MRAKFFMGPKDGGEGTVQTSNGIAPDLYQVPILPELSTVRNPTDLIGRSFPIAYYDLQEVKDNIAYYKYRCTA